ncbi:class I SAM-dependent methyltransferase [Paenibacillus sp. MSJ-34]|uniref:class I SAM-dependent methyltransferase n=1 Tax=Paenibacillus sp. MSJ-34 TaxID=2841529 RepID=UPI001C0FD0CD|nr:class I SAM-dependent methyltransferase [Paenibacillus sp. MSJ-34]MBU5443747.1 class I SAM-dependent methyltransferase [Paenibacillus sp. MSJ-34]
MSEHYYSNRPAVGHDRNTIEATLRGHRLKFVTDAGVFSKGGVDYGSKVLIEHMDIKPDANILDVGCGYGPIGLTAAKLAPDGQVTMIDVNERAVRLAQENAALNGVSNAEALQSDLFAGVAGRRFNTILTNPPIRAGKETVHRIFTESFAHLQDGGSLWVVIQKKQGAPSAKAKLESVFGRVEEVGKDKGYRIFKAVKA